MRAFIFLLFLFIYSSTLVAQKKSCFESVVVPVEYETLSVEAPKIPPRKQIIPYRYRLDTTYVEQVPTGRPDPRTPKQYKMVISRVKEPCPYKVDEDGNCYVMEEVPSRQKTKIETREVPCAYELSATGECIRKIEVLCPEVIKCKTRKSIQTALQAAGYQPGKGKKAFSTTTMTALSSFQADNNLEAVGITMESLKMLLKK